MDYLFIQKGRIEQSRTGIELWIEHEHRPVHASIPVANIGLLALGPGVSITTPAMKTIANAGCTVVFSCAEGITSYSWARPLSVSSRHASAQAALHVNPEMRLAAAVRMYEMREGAPAGSLAGESIAELRGREGAGVRALYRDLAKQYCVGKFKRDTDSSDAINVGLNAGNSVLYGLANTVVTALSLSPALGIIHEGNARAFLFDLADLHKERISIPAAFETGSQGGSARDVQKRVRELIHETDIFRTLFTQVQELLALAPQSSSTKDGEDCLFGPDGFVPAHSNWGLT